MSAWNFTIKIADIFHDDDLEFLEKKQQIVNRIRSSDAYQEFKDDDDFLHLLDDLEMTGDENEFDSVWEDFYEFCDDNSIWIETFNPVA